MSSIVIGRRPQPLREPAIVIEIWGHSIQNGVRRLMSNDAYVVMTACIPGLQPDHLDEGVGTWPVLDHNSERPWATGASREVSEDELIAYARTHLAEAERAIAVLPGVYAAFPALLRAVEDADVSTQDAYEAACQRLGARVIEPKDLRLAGDFRFPEYRGTLDAPFEEWLTRNLAQQRAWTIEHERREMAVIARSGQAQERRMAYEEAQARPVACVYEALVVGGVRDRFDGVRLHSVVEILEHVRIDDDMPSIHGSHLLGHEGERGARVRFEMRSLDPADYPTPAQEDDGPSGP